jgi:hypothetical protein
MRRLFVVLVTASLLMLGLVTPAAAQEEDFSFRDSFTGQMAEAFWSSCEEDTPEPGLVTCTFADIFASSGTARVKAGPGKPTTSTRSVVCAFMDTAVFTTEGNFVDSEFRQGCDENASVSIASDLSTATVDATINLIDFVCEEDPITGEFICEEIQLGTAEVSAAWIGSGPLTKFRDHSRSIEISPDHRCSFSLSGRGVRRQAVATATIDGDALGPSDFASLSDGSLKFAASCRFK